MRGRVLAPAGRPLFVFLFTVIGGALVLLFRGGRALGAAVLPDGFGQRRVAAGSRGANYGWPAFGGHESNRRYTSPLFAYRHGASATTGCAFYNPPVVNFPARYSGDYFFAHFCGGWVRVRDAGTAAVASGLRNPVDLRTGPDGSLHVLERGSGSVAAIRNGGLS